MSKRWYVVHTYSGYENRVKSDLEHRIETMGMQDRIFDIEIPMERVTEIKEGGKRETEDSKIFPGYVLVRMEMDDDSWTCVRNTPGVTGFLGGNGKPAPLSRDEYNKMTRRPGKGDSPKRHLAFLVGILVDSGDLGHVGLAARLGDGADAQDVVGTLDRGQSTAGIEQIEGVAALHDAVISWQRQLALKAGVALGLVVVKLLTHHLDVGDFKVVSAELALVLQEHVAIGHRRAIGQVAPHQVVDRVDALCVHGDTLQADTKSEATVLF